MSKFSQHGKIKTNAQKSISPSSRTICYCLLHCSVWSTVRNESNSVERIMCDLIDRTIRLFVPTRLSNLDR